jgi:PAS domain S-box-containing protein
MRLHDLSLATRVTIGVLAMVVSGTATLLFVENARLRDTYLSERRAHLEKDIEAEKLLLNRAIHTLRQDVLFLSNTPPVSGIVRASLNRGYDSRYSNTGKVWEERLQQIFSAFSIAHPDYYQIRYIGVADGGREIVRIDNRAGKIEVTPPATLQAKGERDYFKATLGLRQGEVHLSEFDLSREWDDIEQPHRPTLRAATPVFTPSGEIFGMVVINMEAGSLLKSAVSDMPGIQTYMANSGGQYLLHPDSRKAFKLEPGTAPGNANKITADFHFTQKMFDPQAPDYLPLQAVATKPDSPLFAARRIYFDPGNPQRFLLLMHYLPGAAVAEQVATIPADTLLYEFMVMLLVGIIAVLALRRTFSPLKQITAAAEKITAGDQNNLLLPTDGGEVGTLTRALNAMLASLSQREKLLRESETRYRRLHESMVDAYAMVDMSGRLLESNHTYREMLGYSAEELKHMTYADLTPEKWYEFEMRIIREQVIPDGYSQVYEKEYIRKDGTVFPVEVKTFLLRDVNNQPDAMWAIVRDITERKQVEKMLLESEELLRRAQSIAHVGHFKYNPSTGVVDGSDELFRIFGLTREQFQFSDFVNSVHPDDRALDVATIESAIEKKAGYKIEHRLLLRDGTLKWVSAIGELVTALPEEQSLLIGTVQDITERKQVEAERKQAEDLMQQFGSLLQGSFNEIYMFDADSLHFILTSEGAEKKLGYSDDELNQLTPLDLMPSFTRESFEQLVAPLRAGEQQLLHFETVHRRKDGTAYPVEVNLQLIFTTTTTTTFLVVIQDITERKQAEDILRLHSAILKNLSEGVFLVRASDGVIVFCNPQFERMFGYESGELLGKHVSIVNALGAKTPKAIAIEIMGELERVGVWNNELQNIRKNGTTFWCRASVSTFEHHEFGKVWVSAHEDITERKLTEQKLHDLAAHLQSVREEEKNSIAREIHDDMGGTLTALKIETYWLKDELSACEDAVPLLNRLGEMSQLIDKAMGVMRGIINGLRPTLLDDLGLLAALEWQAAQFQKNTGIECRVNCVCTKDEECAKELDKPRSIALFRIAQEALTNVAKHSGATRVEIEFHRSDDEIVLSIIDNGCGMTKNRPETSNQSTSIPYGVLGMCERVDQLGGKINFDTPPDGGFNVTIILPLPGKEGEET